MFFYAVWIAIWIWPEAPDGKLSSKPNETCIEIDERDPSIINTDYMPW